MGAGEPGATRAGIAVDFICACPSVEARAFSTVGDVGFTVDASKARSAGAGVGVHVVCAGAAVLAGGTLTFVDLYSTAGPSEAWQAATVERVHAICTGASAQAWVRGAVIDVCLTGQPSVSSSTGTHKASKCVGAGPAVLTGVGDAFIHINVAQLTLPPWLAVALVAQVVWCVSAESMVSAGVRGAGCEHFSTGRPAVRKLTQTGETGHTVHTGALVQTRAG